jgi:hypothetical protein
MLHIKNQHKLLGKAIYSKFLPRLGEWKVVSILKDEYSYDIKIQNTKTRRDWEKIYLDRRPYFDYDDSEPKYKMWGMVGKGGPKSKMIKKGKIQDIDSFIINMLLLLKEMKYTL